MISLLAGFWVMYELIMGSARIAEARPMPDLSRAYAPNMMLYHQAAVAYAAASGTAGPIAESSLALPAWYGKTANWQSLSTGGYVVTWTADALPFSNYRLADRLMKTGDRDIGIAIARTGNAVSFATNDTLIALPNQIPNGTALYVTRIN